MNTILLLLCIILLSSCGAGLCPMRTLSSSCQIGGSVQWLSPIGAIDTSFGTAGITITSLNNGVIRSIALQPDGKALIGGYWNGPTQFAILRYHTNGSLDTTFGTAGVATTVIQTNDEINEIKVLSNGKILAVGRTNFTNVAMARYHTNGSLDTTFGTAGIVNQDFGSSENAKSFVVQPDGKIVVAGSGVAVIDDWALMRFTADGILDTTFGTGGRTTTDFGFGSSEDGYKVTQLSNGKFLLTGQADDLGKYVVARYDSNGILDTTFGTAGIGYVPAGSGSYITSVFELMSGKIIVGGSNSIMTSYGMARYYANGIIDTTFGTAGVWSQTLFGNDEAYDEMYEQPDGKIVGAGSHADAGWSYYPTIGRHHSNGSLDTTFGTAGRLIVDVGGTGDSYVGGITMSPSGSIFVGGSLGTNNDVFIMKVK